MALLPVGTIATPPGTMEDWGKAETGAGADWPVLAPKDNMTTIMIMMADDLVNILVSSLLLLRWLSLSCFVFEFCLQF